MGLGKKMALIYFGVKGLTVKVTMTFDNQNCFQPIAGQPISRPKDIFFFIFLTFVKKYHVIFNIFTGKLCAVFFIMIIL
jgi:hypothetical protein